MIKTRIDWVSFSIEVGEIAHFNAPLLVEILHHHLVTRFPDTWLPLLFDDQDWQPVNSRAPYRVAAGRSDRGVRVYGGWAGNSILVEVTGRALDPVRRIEEAQALLERLPGKLSRLDIAHDIETDVTPAEFINDRAAAVSRSVSSIESRTGWTAYLGSLKSDRFIRVYRYARPHPRARFLRIEHVYRKQYAEAARRVVLLSRHWGDVRAATAKEAEWRHPVWDDPGAEDIDLAVKLKTVSRQESETLLWVERAVVPALARLWQAGVLDLHDLYEAIVERANQTA